MRYIAFILIVTFVSGCASGPGPAAERLRGYKDAYQTCLRANNGDDNKCVSQKKIYDAELQYYQAGNTASGQTATVCNQIGKTMVCNK